MKWATFFADSNQLQLLKAMEVKALTLPFVRDRHGHVMTIIVSLWGRYPKIRLLHNGQVSVATESGLAVVFGRLDIVKQQELYERGYYVKFIELRDLWERPALVRNQLQKFFAY